jgi:hypothetical protein
LFFVLKFVFFVKIVDLDPESSGVSIAVSAMNSTKTEDDYEIDEEKYQADPSKNFFSLSLAHEKLFLFTLGMVVSFSLKIRPKWGIFVF